jgi:hypothetical protein
MNHQPETHAMLANRSPLAWLVQAPVRRAFFLRKPGLASSLGHPRATTAWRNVLALAAVAVAITLLVVKNLDRNSPSPLSKGSAVFEVGAGPTANP